MLSFASPYFLLLLPVLAVLWLLKRRTAARPAMAVSTAAFTPSPSGVLRLAPVVSALKGAAIVLLALALSGPRLGTEEIRILTEGVNIVLAVDISESMAALDFEVDGERVDRLTAVKSVVADFISKREGDRIGLVVFGSEAYTQLPLTRDYNAIMDALSRIKIGAAGKSTAIGDGLGISVKRIKDVESKTDVVILLTDGRSNSGEISPDAAAGIAERAGVKVYTIGVGGDGPAPFIVQHPVFGPQMRQAHFEIDEQTLKNIAEKTDALYFNAEDTDGLQKIYDTINGLEKNTVEVKTFAEYNLLYPYFVGPALALLALWVVLANTRFLRAP